MLRDGFPDSGSKSSLGRTGADYWRCPRPRSCSPRTPATSRTRGTTAGSGVEALVGPSSSSAPKGRGCCEAGDAPGRCTGVRRCSFPPDALTSIGPSRTIHGLSGGCTSRGTGSPTGCRRWAPSRAPSSSTRRTSPGLAALVANIVLIMETNASISGLGPMFHGGVATSRRTRAAPTKHLRGGHRTGQAGAGIHPREPGGSDIDSGVGQSGRPQPVAPVGHLPAFHRNEHPAIHRPVQNGPRTRIAEPHRRDRSRRRRVGRLRRPVLLQQGLSADRTDTTASQYRERSRNANV